MKKHQDQLKREISVSSIPKRIVSLVPSQTELLVDLGLENEIVGITEFCAHPFHLISVKPIVGGTKKVDFKKIKSLKPDLILGNKEENTFMMLPELEKIAPTFFSDVITIDDTIDLIEKLGILLNRRTESINMIDKIRFKLENFKVFMSDRPIRAVAYFIWADPWMVAGSETYIDSLLKLNNFNNIYGYMNGYPKVDISKIRIEGDPEIILLSSEPYAFKDEHALKLGTYTNRAVTVFADGTLFSWYGSRLLKAFDYFKSLQKRIESHF